MTRYFHGLHTRYFEIPKADAGVAAMLRPNLSIEVLTGQHDDTPVAREDRDDKVAVFSLILPLGRDHPPLEKTLGQVRLVYSPCDEGKPDPEYGPPERVLRYHSDHRGNEKVSVPALWPGAYLLLARVHDLRPDGKPGAQLGEPLREKLVVSPGRLRIASLNPLPFFLSNLIKLAPTPDVCEMAGLPFTLERTGYPVLDLTRAVPALNRQSHRATAARLLVPLLPRIEKAALPDPSLVSPFGPVLVRDVDLGFCDRSRAAMLGASIPEPSRTASRKLSLSAEGIVTKTQEMAGVPADVAGENYREGVKWTEEALQRDPHNLHAYLWMAVSQSLLGADLLAYDYFLTLYGRLRCLETIAAGGRTGLRGHLVGTTLQAFAPAGFFDRLRIAAAALQLDSCMKLRFPHLE